MKAPAASPLCRAREPRNTRVCSHRRRRDRRGLAVVYVCLIVLILMFFVSIGVDMGRVRVSKNQLQTATDAAAFAGAMALPSADHSDATGRAGHGCRRELRDGTAVALQPANDIQFGLYRQTTHVYTPVGSAEPGRTGTS
jgi:hypothetical protein